MRTILTAVAMLAAVSQAQAQADDGNMLMRTCRPMSPELGYCIGYARGTLARAALERVYYCLPDTARDTAMVDAILGMLEGDKSLLPYPAGMLIARAMDTAYPCPNRITP